MKRDEWFVAISLTSLAVLAFARSVANVEDVLTRRFASTARQR
jgi:hypothetical protein